jgi:hypothetical protein
MHDTLRKFFQDKKGRIVLWQTPNAFLVGWAVCMVASRLLQTGTVRQILGYIGFGSIVIWALLELFDGASYFRRSLGAVVLLASVYARFG